MLDTQNISHIQLPITRSHFSASCSCFQWGHLKKVQKRHSKLPKASWFAEGWRPASGLANMMEGISPRHPES